MKVLIACVFILVSGKNMYSLADYVEVNNIGNFAMRNNSLPNAAYKMLKNGQIISKIIFGMWQLSGGHGYKPKLHEGIEDMKRVTDAGFITFDLADHYGPAEDYVGHFRDKFGTQISDRTSFFTKWVPNPGPMPIEVVASALDKSRSRMKMNVLDSVQFHWWDYSDARYLNMLEAAQQLSLSESVLGQKRLNAVSLTNFDSIRLREIVDKGINIISNQVSFSIVDTRPLKAMTAIAEENGIQLLCYGALLGGLLSDTWLGVADPQDNRRGIAGRLNTASLRKYYDFVVQWGGSVSGPGGASPAWILFQELLVTCRAIGDKHGNVSIATVAIRWVLQQQAVGAVIVGARLGHAGWSDHIDENRRVFEFELDANDLSAIAAVQAKGNSLPGDCGDEYRHPR